jgi:hypothetical protein
MSNAVHHKHKYKYSHCTKIYAYTTINLGFIWALILRFIQQVCSLTYLRNMQYHFLLFILKINLKNARYVY